MQSKVWKTIPGLLMLIGGLLARAEAGAMTFNLEMRELHPEINLFARDVYACTTCTLAQYAAIVPPEGWEKAPARVGLWSSASIDGPPDIPGVPLGQDFVPEIPGDEFAYIARVLDGQILGFVDGVIQALTQVQRSTTHTFDAGSVIHEVVDPDGNRYVMFTFDHLLSVTTYDLDAVGSLAGLPVAVGWSYESSLLTEALVIDSGGLANVYVQGNLGAFQRYSLPAPGPLALFATPLAWAAARWRRRR